jgi:hypothetical protein
LSPHESSGEDVWSFLTCCWLLDVALWRFGADADRRRFIGDVNRNTFRRLWWRAEILCGGPESEAAMRVLGEDELVNIMERPTLARDVRLARCIVAVFSGRAGSLPDVGLGRMDVMRDLTKRVLRLTPFIDLAALGQVALERTVQDQMDRSIAALLGRPPPAAVLIEDGFGFQESPGVERLDEIAAPGDQAPDGQLGDEDLSELALDLARRTGRVTNGGLRELVPGLTSDEARAVLTGLLNRGRLERRGEKRGTHYVIPQRAAPGPGEGERPGMLRRLLGGRN